MTKKIKRFVGSPQKDDSSNIKKVNSLLDEMKDGREYESIIPLTPITSDLVPEIKRAISEIENIRSRPLLCYFANVVRPMPEVLIQSSDDLPFNEMVNSVESSIMDVDVMVVTPGGSGQ